MQLLQQLSCSDTAPDSWIPISDVINIGRRTSYTFRQLRLQTNIAHRVKVETTNGAQLKTSHSSEAIFVDITLPTQGLSTTWRLHAHYICIYINNLLKPKHVPHTHYHSLAYSFHRFRNRWSKLVWAGIFPKHDDWTSCDHCYWYLPWTMHLEWWTCSSSEQPDMDNCFQNLVPRIKGTCNGWKFVKCV